VAEGLGVGVIVEIGTVVGEATIVSIGVDARLGEQDADARIIINSEEAKKI